MIKIHLLIWNITIGWKFIPDLLAIQLIIEYILRKQRYWKTKYYTWVVTRQGKRSPENIGPYLKSWVIKSHFKKVYPSWLIQIQSTWSEAPSLTNITRRFTAIASTSLNIFPPLIKFYSTQHWEFWEIHL